MDVFIVVGDHDYEFSVVAGVFDNLADAEARAKTALDTYDNCHVSLWRVGDTEELKEVLWVSNRAKSA